MSPQLISIYALGAMFVVATLLPINMGVLAFVGAFLVGTLVAGQSTKEIIAGFPGGLFLTLVGITYLFALAQNNGTIDWLVQLAQGNRMNGRSCGLADEGLEVASIPAGALPAVLQAGRGLGPMQQAHGHVLDHGHVLGPVAGP